MMIQFQFYLLISCLAFFSSCGNESGESGPMDEDKEEPVYKALFQADPTIFRHGDTYYIYGTNDEDPNQGFQVYTSQDLEVWEGPKGMKSGYALHKGDVFGDVGFWAPQVWFEKDKFYMAYTANEHIAIATSNSPLGPFTQDSKRPVIEGVKQIDPFVFKDDDGKTYLFHVRLTEGNRIFVVELAGDYSGVKAETLVECIAADQPWENEAQASWPVAEGPTVIKQQDRYYLFYSANDFRNQKYAVGYAISEHIGGPWIKSEANPLLSIHNTGWPGSGHGDLFQDAEGAYHYVFHTHFSKSQVGPRRTAIVPVLFEEENAGILKPQFLGNEMIHIKAEMK